MLSSTGLKERLTAQQDGNDPKSFLKRSSWRVYALCLLALGSVIIGIVAATRPDQSATRGNRAFGPLTTTPVTVTSVSRTDIPITVQALGTVTPLDSVVARTRVPGQIIEVAFTEGQHVNQGDLLVVVDPRPYELALEQAKSQLARDEAQLNIARLDLERYKTLVKHNAASRQQLDTQLATVHQFEASVASSTAMMRAAELNLKYTRTVAPISGRLGLRQIDKGNYAQTNDSNGLVTIAKMNPISVLFSVPEDQIATINRRSAEKKTLPVILYNRNRTQKLAEGYLQTIDNQADPATGTVRLRAVFDNEDEALFPNQFVNVDLIVDTRKNTLVIPPSARLIGASGAYAWRIDNEDKTARIQPIKTGLSTAHWIEITEGLKQGDLVVTDGSDRLRAGMRVTIPGNEQEAPSTASSVPSEKMRQQSAG